MVVRGREGFVEEERKDEGQKAVERNMSNDLNRIRV